MKISKLLTALTATFAFATGAQAAGINGELGFGGVLDLSQTNIVTATSLDFVNVATASVGTGDLSGVTSVTPYDFSFNPFASPSTIWDGGGFTFQLTTIEIDFQGVDQNHPGGFLQLSGTGIVSAAGFDDTVAVWNLSADNVGGILNVYSQVTDVPEPGAITLLGLALLGLGLANRRRNTLPSLAA